MLECPTACIDVVRDGRYKRCRRVRYMNMLADAHPNPHFSSNTRPVVHPQEFGRQWAKPARVPVEWINTGSVWRVLPKTGWEDRDPHHVITLDQLRVVSTIGAGGRVVFGRIDDDGELQEMFGRGAMWAGDGNQVLPFISNHCRVWASTALPEAPDLQGELFPEILYPLGLLERPTPVVPKPKPKRQTRRKGKAVRRKRQKPRLTAWERLMKDE